MPNSSQAGAEGRKALENLPEWDLSDLYPGPESKPQDYVDFEFRAAKGTYAVWLRGKAAGGLRSDSMWLQLDREVGTKKGDQPAAGLGNWRDAFPSNAYAWSSAYPEREPWTITFERL